MKIRVIFDNIEGCYFVQYRKWWYLTGWQTYQEQLTGHWGASTTPLRFRTLYQALHFLDKEVEKTAVKKKLNKEQLIKEKNRIKVISNFDKVNVDAPSYFHYSH